MTTKMKLYSVDVQIFGTLYIKTTNQARARRLAQQVIENRRILELREQNVEGCGVPISGRKFEDPELPRISLSPAMTLHKLVTDDVQEV